MAIAFDLTTPYDSAGNESTSTFSHTVTGSNPFLFIFIRRNQSVADVTGVTYAGTSMTLVPGSAMTVGVAGNDGYVSYYLFNPATGANNVVISCSSALFGTNARAASYTGVLSTSLDSKVTTNPNNSGATTLTLTTTTVADNCWLVAGIRNQVGNFTAGANTTLRGAGNALSIADSNAAQTPAGSKSLTATHAASYDAGTIISISPTAATVLRSNLLLMGVG